YVVSSGGMAHTLNPQIGTDVVPPVKFLPPGTKVVGSIFVDGVLYAATSDTCGGTANGLWAIDLASDAKTISTFDSNGAVMAGGYGPAFGADGTIYVTTGRSDSASTYAKAVVSLEPRTLNVKDWMTGSGAFVSAPIVFPNRTSSRTE